MMKKRTAFRPRITWLFALPGLLIVILLVWMAAAGPRTVYRIIRYGDSDIGDFKHYPGRTMQPPEQPFELRLSPGEILLTTGLRADNAGERSLDELLSAHDTTAMLVLRQETILYERYFQGHDQDSLSQAFSMSKSFTSALIGLAIDDGLLSGTDQPLVDIIPELKDRGLDQVRLEDLLTMTSGSDYRENDNPFREHVILNYTPTLEKQILKIKGIDNPGEVFRYKSGDNALLGLVLDRVLGKETITGYAQRRLWKPMGAAQPGIWSLDREGGLEKTWCCLAASARDYARFGLLYLNRGRLGGQQILSRDWTLRSTTPQVSGAVWPEDFREAGWQGYGYQWWLAGVDDGDFFALGKDGQFIYVNPAAEVVIIRLGWSAGEMSASQWIQLFQDITQQVVDRS